MMTRKKPRRSTGLTRTSIAAAFVLMLFNTAAWGQSFHCLPSCDQGDTRFLSIPGAGLASFTGQEINIQIVIPGERADFALGIFDGDTGLTSPPINISGEEPVDHWDLNTGQLQFDLYADPLGDASGTILVVSLNGQSMPDNDWFTQTVANVDEAQGADGAFRYNLRIRLLDGALAISNFKLRILPTSVMAIVRNAFGFQSGGFSLDDLLTLYPELPNLDVTPYDGSFRFFSLVPDNVTEFVVSDGDFDHGSPLDGTADTDDPDTPNDSLPSWFVAGTRLEGVNPSSPADDRGPVWLTRTPSVIYSVAKPGHTQVFVNNNPSGSEEWEQFRIATDPFDASTMDYSTSSLPPGIYTIDVAGLDVQNFGAWHANRIECVTSDGTSCPRLSHFTLGDTVFEDVNRDGAQDEGESGIVGVLMNLLNRNGRLLDQTITDSDGRYSFTVTNGDFSVAVSAKNFVLAGPAGALGDKVWLDANANGNQDTGEPGLANITLQLFDAGADDLPGGGDDRFLAAATTDVSGRYRFNNLNPGSYFVTVQPGALPAGLSLSPLSDPTPLRTITAAERFLDLDFAYVSATGTAMIGGSIWLDNDGTPNVRGSGEPGISDVTVHLCNLTSGPCADFADFTDFATSGRTRDGTFMFTGLVPAMYSVVVTDRVGRLRGLTLTTPLPNPSPAFPLGANDAKLDVNFGYQGDDLYAIDDAVWLDEDRDGMRDAGEVGLAGVTVNLLDARGEVIATGISEATGEVRFAGLHPGAYRLAVTDLDDVLVDLIPTRHASIHGVNVMIANGDLTGENFGYNMQGQLASYSATTESPTQHATVSDTDILTLDFGYHNECGACAGKVTALSLQYLGTHHDAHIEVMQKRPRVLVYDAVVQPGQSFEVLGADGKGTLSTEIKVYVNGELSAEFHTSCSQPIGPGLRIGELKVVAGSSRRGGALCPVDGQCHDDDSADDHASTSDDHSDDNRRGHGHHSDDDSSDDDGQCQQDQRA